MVGRANSAVQEASGAAMTAAGLVGVYALARALSSIADTLKPLASRQAEAATGGVGWLEALRQEEAEPGFVGPPRPFISSKRRVAAAEAATASRQAEAATGGPSVVPVSGEKLTCPHCGTVNLLAAGYVGTLAKCGKCGQTFTVPTEEKPRKGEPAVAAEAAEAAKPSGEPAVPAFKTDLGASAQKQAEAAWAAAHPMPSPPPGASSEMGPLAQEVLARQAA
jgi:hypothetical protein